MKKGLIYLFLLGAMTLGFSAHAGNIHGKVTAKKTGLVSEVVVYLRTAAGTFKPSKELPVMDQKNLKFIPRVLPVLAGTTVTFKNSDNVKHNVFTPDGDEKYDFAFGPGVTEKHIFNKPGIYTQLCNVHPEMEAYIVVLQNPYFTQVRPDGTFMIRNVPTGDYEIKTWHDILKKASRKITVGSGVTTVDFEL